MRKPSVADELVRAERERVAALSPEERIALALELGRRALADYAAARQVDLARARLEVERQRQSQRRHSACLEALLA